MKLALVRRAAAEYFSEGFQYGDIARTIENTPPEERVAAYESLRPRRTVPEGCFVWIAHLVWLEGMLKVAPIQLTAEEAASLQVLKEERQHFQATHPACPRCGLPNSPHAFRCRECMAEIQH